MTTFDVRPFSPTEATPAQRLAVGHLLSDCYSHTYPTDPPLSPQTEAEGLLQVTPDGASQHFAVWDEEKAVGYASLTYSLTQNRHAAQAQILVLPDFRRRGLGRQLAAALREAAGAQGHTLVTFFTTSLAPGGEAFAGFLGAEAALVNRTSRLLLSEVPAELLSEWQRRPEGDPYRLHVWERIPDEDLERVADVMMVMNTAPRGEGTDDWTITPEMVRAWDD